jgi:aspartate aminotransferase
VSRQASGGTGKRASGFVLSKRAAAIQPSPTVATAQRAAALKARGERVLDFSVGEPDQDTPRHVTEAAIAALQAGKTRYAPAAGIPELRAAVARRYEADFAVSFSPSEVLIANGGKQALYLACQALLDRGCEVVVPAPCWPTFGESVRLAGGRPVVVHTRSTDGFRVTARLVRRAVGPRTRAVILNSPSNPTGAVIEPAELEAIGALAARRGFALIWDDTYAHLSFGGDGGPAPVLQRLRDRLGERFVVVGTASKTYCMTGWRIGWVLGGKALVDACAALVSHSTQCPSTFAQYGAVQALGGSQDAVRALAAEYRRRRDFFHPVVAGIEDLSCVRPEGGFYLFPDVSRYLGRGLATSLALTDRLLDEEKVAVVAGEGFEAPGYVRISFARPMDELREGADRLRAFFDRWR